MTAHRLPAVAPPVTTAAEDLAAALALALNLTRRAHDATSSLSERDRLAHHVAMYDAALGRYMSEPAPTMRATHTDDGEPLGRVIEELYSAIPNSAVRTQKLADALSKARNWFYRPRFRFLANDGTGAVVFTECDTGRRVTIPAGRVADIAREMWSPRSRGDANAQGEGIGGAWEDDVAALFPR